MDGAAYRCDGWMVQVPTLKPAAAQAAQADLVRRLEHYQDRLLDVSWRNRSILLRKIHLKWNADLAGIGDAVAREAVAAGLLGRAGTCLVRDTAKGREADAARHNLTALARQANLIEDETGLRQTYVGFPFLVGRITPEHVVRAPVLLFPVRVLHTQERKPAGWHAEVLADEEPVVNRALLAALRKVAGIRIPVEVFEAIDQTLEALRASPEAAAGNAATAVWARLVDLLPTFGIPVPQANLAWDGKFELVEGLAKEDEGKIGADPLHLEPLCVLGSFPQGSEAIYEDYATLLERARGGERDQGIVDDLLEAPADRAAPVAEGAAIADIDLDRVRDGDLNTVVETDGSQDQVLVAAQGSECTVVRGPPGTGKSQVIVNLISNALWKGERVLVVCQKRAALDVVYQRLQGAGLGQAAIVVHDAMSDRAATYRQLAQRIKGSVPPPAPQLTVAQLNARIDELIAELNRIVKPLWEPVRGARLADLYARAEPKAEPRWPPEVTGGDVDYPSLLEILELLRQIEPGARRFDSGAHAWRDRTSFADLGPFGATGIRDLLAAAAEAARVDYAEDVGHANPALLGQHLRVYLAKRESWTRHFSGKWRRARDATRAYLARRGLPETPTNVEAEIVRVDARLALHQRLVALSPYLNFEAVAQVTKLASSRAALEARLAALAAGLADYDALQAHDRARAGLKPAASRVLAACLARLANDPRPWATTVEQEFVLRWIAEAERRHPELTGDPFGVYQQRRAQLQTLLDQRRRLLALELERKLLTTARVPVLPPGTHHPNRQADTDWNKVSYELEKRRRVWPIRRLVETFPHVIPRIAPCWLVSPETVSEVFPLARGLFDLVVFDEASQLAVERALPTLYRGRRIVIAGDEKQLRPFDLFRTRGDDEEEERAEPALEAESLLMLAKRIYGFRYLAWHYRSRFQELIDYSNHAFYDGTLQIAASTRRGPAHAPIRWHSVKGSWANRSNAKEASYVVDLTKRILEEHKADASLPTIGVITFNDEQRNVILDEIERRREADPAFGELYARAENPPDGNLDKKPFVKNIENVQGDERDVIVFSVAYGRDPGGALRAQFGSLSVDGGENRLNVAVTRAKSAIHVVCSFDPKDLKVDAAQNEGPKRLKDYLLYARAVSASDAGAVAGVLAALNPALKSGAAVTEGKAAQGRLEEQLSAALVKRGYRVEPRVGFSGYSIDLAVLHPMHPDRYLLAIECDGATFHGAKSARERDVARPRFLERMGWNVERVWSRNWWRSRDQEIARVTKVLDRLAGQP